MTAERGVRNGSRFVPFDSEHTLGTPSVPEQLRDAPPPAPPIQYQIPSAWRLDPIEAPDHRDTHRGLIALAVISVVIGLISGFLIIRGIQQDGRASRVSPMPQSRFQGSDPGRLPAPTAGETTPPQRTAAGNALYYADFATTPSCRGFVPRDSGVPRSKRGEYLKALVDCLTEVHRGPLAKVGVKLTAPALIPAESAVGTACQEYAHADWGARYCPGDQTITYRLSDQGGDDPTSDAVLVAHEFGHHMQYAAGILDDSEARVDGGADKDEMTRREELQAACMVGVAINAPWSPIRLPRARQQAYLISVADSPQDWDHTHGTGEAQRRWTKSGMTNAPSPYSSCNTWSVSAQDVA